MSDVVSFPTRGEVFFDARGEGRAMRLSWHQADGLVVLSLWRDGSCSGSFRLHAADVPAFVNGLVSGLAAGPTYQAHSA